MSDVIEKAMAAFADNCDGVGRREGDYFRVYDGGFDLRVAIRAVISSLRDPTEGMIDAIVSIEPGALFHLKWRAGIDAALEPPPE